MLLFILSATPTTEEVSPFSPSFLSTCSLLLIDLKICALALLLSFSDRCSLPGSDPRGMIWMLTDLFAEPSLWNRLVLVFFTLQLLDSI